MDGRQKEEERLEDERRARKTKDCKDWKDWKDYRKIKENYRQDPGVYNYDSYRSSCGSKAVLCEDISGENSELFLNLNEDIAKVLSRGRCIGVGDSVMYDRRNISKVFNSEFVVKINCDCSVT